MEFSAKGQAIALCDRVKAAQIGMTLEQSWIRAYSVHCILIRR